MKTTIELNGFDITIEELEGKITVSASKEGEMVEEFELNSEEGGDNEEGMEGEELVPFGEEGEEDDLGGEDQEEMEGDDEFSDDDESGDDDDDDESKLESFTSFIKKRKK